MSTNTSKDTSLGLHEEPKQSSRWTEIEDSILKQGVARHGVSHWDDVAKMIWTRKSAEECRARWAELVPLLHDSLARRESDLEQYEHRKRSMTESASASKTSQCQEAAYFQPLLSPVVKEQKQESREEVTETTAHAKSNTRPSTPNSQVPPTIKPPLSSGLAPTAVSALRSRRNTEPGARPCQTAASSSGEQKYEWLAPHPLMPGRFRNPSVSSRNTPASRNGDDTKTAPEEDFRMVGGEENRRSW
ncbi:hypothetical protein F4776DRAFT_623346 [Hypoxylon sp. NC0597]|nr:hypothetical protein F4776DRAFT_623346 [Hypoxylon sp. NC0597]